MHARYSANRTTEATRWCGTFVRHNDIRIAPRTGLEPARSGRACHNKFGVLATLFINLPRNIIPQ